ncbi:MAG: hypothetical protein IPF54_18895 [Draconibacterium sp.]|nr:hypothetical protein [Draconibacterium sp.]
MKYGLIAAKETWLSSSALDRFAIQNHEQNAWINLTQPSKVDGNFFNSSILTGGNPRNPSLKK